LGSGTAVREKKGKSKMNKTRMTFPFQVKYRVQYIIKFDGMQIKRGAA